MSYSLEQLPQCRGAIRANKQLARMCWFGVGGAVDFFFSPADADDLQHFLQNKPADLPVMIFGVGSNVLVRDGGFRGVAIRLGAGFNYVEDIGQARVKVGCSTLDLNVAMFAANLAIGGLEFLSGIPGTIGGAVAMNAGAYGREIKDVLIEVTAYDLCGEKRIVNASDFGFIYRGHSIIEPLIFTEAVLQGHPDDHELIRERMLDIQDKRAATQPIKSKTGGSTFTNPPGHSAWKLIDEAGCRGLRIGGAMVSELHCNFLINTGDATANDLEQLVLEVQRRVFENSGVMLHPEIKIIGQA